MGCQSLPNFHISEAQALADKCFGTNYTQIFNHLEGPYQIPSSPPVLQLGQAHTSQFP